MNTVAPRTAYSLGTRAILDDLIRRIVEVAQPDKIILFGSAARGEDRADSDIDVLVVKNCASRRTLSGKIYQALIGVGRAVDVVVATPDDVERFSSSSSMVIAPAVREGKLVYAR